MKIKNLSLVSKQVLGFGLILLIMLGVNLFSLIKLAQLKQDVDDVTQLWLPSVIAVSEINTESSALRISELQHAFSKQEEDMLGFEETMNVTKERIEQVKFNYEKLISTEMEKDLFRRISNKWQRYTELNNEFLQLSRNRIKEESLFLLNDESLELFNELTTDLNELVRLNKKYAFDSAERADITYNSTRYIIFILLASTILISIFISILLVRTIIKPIQLLEKGVESVASGNDSFELKIYSTDEIGNLAQSFNKMTKALRKAREENQLQDWIKSGQNQLNEIMRGDLDLSTLARNVITFLSQYINAHIGALYIWEEEQRHLKLIGSYAFTRRKNIGDTIKLGEGLIGQAAMEKQIISITNIPEGYIEITSALGSIPPKNVIAVPFLYENQLIGVIEFGMLQTVSKREMDLFEIIMKNIAMGFNSANSRNKIRFLLEESQVQAQVLKKQQLKLKSSNEELEEQTIALRESEAALQAQREELQTTNDELEEKTNYLEKHKKEIIIQNQELEEARNNITKKAKELEEISKYKSEFLANMSHELRTPLNSLLILARSLAENSLSNLTTDQIESAKIIYNSGNDLLELINDILDLSKIEAGKMSLNIDKFRISDFERNLHSTFNHMIEEKNLYLKVEIDKNLPEYIVSDYQKITQVIKNLMSNSIKFTSQGGIVFTIYEEHNKEQFVIKTLRNAKKIVAFSVKDTGIGIKEEKQIAVFEAFQQADGSTSRKFGGTGLGLSISRQLVKLLGGEIKLISQYGVGSEFVFYIPAKIYEHNENEVNTETEIKTENKEVHTNIENYKQSKTILKNILDNVYDDRLKIIKNDKIIIAIEPDLNFTRILHKLCSQKGFKFLSATSGEEGIDMAVKYHPVAIVLDLKLPGISGWEVLEILKEKKQTRHIPVHIISGDNVEYDVLKRGAIGFISKPVNQEKLEEAFNSLENVINKKIKDLLIVEDNNNLRKSIVKLIKSSDVNCNEASTGTEALKMIKEQNFDCVVLDLGLPDMQGSELLNILSQEKDLRIPPVIVYTGKDLCEQEHQQLEKYADSIIIKGVKSEERLLDETALFLHRVIDDLPDHMQKIITDIHNSKDDVFRDKKILIVDDDMRNVFALSKILKEKGLIIIKAEDGKKALKLLHENEDTKLILMDIMMPVMDGYTCMREIRKIPKYFKLPIIALTAKAMKEDREKCMEAGATDYMSKPVDMERLVSLIRVWLYN